MAEQAIHEMVAAYAVGCMDKQNFVQFKDYMHDGGDLPDGELGELQNIVTMIPVILDLEKPHGAIKDAVAQKLISMKEEIKAKIINDRRTMVNTFTKAQTIASIPDFANTKPLASTQVTPVLKTVNLKSKATETVSTLDLSSEDFGKTFSQTDIFKDTKAKITPVADTKTTLKVKDVAVTEEVKKTTLEETKVIIPPVEQKQSSSGWVGILGIILTILLCTILGYYTFISTQKANDKIEELQNQLTSIRSQLATANSFVGSNASLVEFLNYKDIIVVNFAGQSDNSKAAAKILLSFSEKEGLIQFKNPQALQQGQYFQLWAVSKGQSYSAGTYKPVGTEFIKISPFPFLPKEQIESYKITIENGTGITTPSANTYMISENGSGSSVKRGR